VAIGVDDDGDEVGFVEGARRSIEGRIVERQLGDHTRHKRRAMPRLAGDKRRRALRMQRRNDQGARPPQS